MKSIQAIGALVLFTACASAPPPPPEQPPLPEPSEAPLPPPSADGSILLTVFLKHDQTKSLAEIQQLQEEQGFWKAFPPRGTSIVSWHVVMGIGQVVTLRVPANRLRDVNVALEKTAWKAFRTEYYATYDLWPVIAGKLPNAVKEGGAPGPVVATEPAPPEPSPSTTATTSNVPPAPSGSAAPPVPRSSASSLKPPAPGEKPPTTPRLAPTADPFNVRK